VARAGDLIDVDNGPGTDLRTVLGVAADLSGTFAESDGLNNLGEIAFTAVFTDGSNGVFVSSIGAVSEPSTCVLSAVCFLLLPLMRRRRNCRSEKS
jgi:hypothetical protein